MVEDPKSQDHTMVKQVSLHCVCLQIEQDFDPVITKIEGILRGSLLKLHYADACMKPLPKGLSLCTYYLVSCRPPAVRSM